MSRRGEQRSRKGDPTYDRTRTASSTKQIVRLEINTQKYASGHRAGFNHTTSVPPEGST